MAFDAHKNFAVSLVATAPSPAASGTSLVVTAGEGVRFPIATAFNAVVFPSGQMPTPANAEIVRVTAITTDTFTITRAQESSGARTIVVGDIICAAITAKTLSDLESSPVWTSTVTAFAFAATLTGASTGYLVGAAAGNWGARLSRSAGGPVLLGVPGTTSADHFTIVSSAGADLIDVTGAGLIKFAAYTGTTFTAGSFYLVVDASGNVQRSATGPAS